MQQQTCLLRLSHTTKVYKLSMLLLRRTKQSRDLAHTHSLLARMFLTAWFRHKIEIKPLNF